jgi:hypothetical protein
LKPGLRPGPGRGGEPRRPRRHAGPRRPGSGNARRRLGRRATGKRIGDSEGPDPAMPCGSGQPGDSDRGEAGGLRRGLRQTAGGRRVTVAQARHGVIEVPAGSSDRRRRDRDRH